jgi:hypothetical protein
VEDLREFHFQIEISIGRKHFCSEEIS